MTVQIACFEGRFNLLDPSQKQWQLSVRTPHGNVSELFDDEPYWDGSLEDALNVIEARSEGYFFSSSRSDKRQKIAAIRDHLSECEIALLENQIRADERRIEQLAESVAKAKRTIAFLRSELSEVTP